MKKRLKDALWWRRRLLNEHLPYLFPRVDCNAWAIRIQRFFNQIGLPVTENDRAVRSLRNKYKDKRCFIIGNGPSLRMSDLSAIKNDVSIASNKIYLAFEDTIWRPTLYTIIDSVVMNNINEEIKKFCFLSAFPEQFKAGIAKTPLRAVFVPLLTHGAWNGDSYDSFTPGFSVNPAKGFFHGESVTYFNLQWAYYMGCNPIYLIGVDFSFIQPRKMLADASFGGIYHGEGEINHFHKNYRPLGEAWTRPNLREQQLCFEYAFEFLKKRGVSLLNASRKTELTSVPTVDFDSLL